MPLNGAISRRVAAIAIMLLITCRPSISDVATGLECLRVTTEDCEITAQLLKTSADATAAVQTDEVIFQQASIDSAIDHGTEGQNGRG